MLCISWYHICIRTPQLTKSTRLRKRRLLQEPERTALPCGIPARRHARTLIYHDVDVVAVAEGISLQLCALSLSFRCFRQLALLARDVRIHAKARPSQDSEGCARSGKLAMICRPRLTLVPCGAGAARLKLNDVTCVVSHAAPCELLSAPPVA